MDNAILHLIGISDPDIIVESEEDDGSNRVITIVKEKKPMFCPECGHRMKSKGSGFRKMKNSGISNNSATALFLMSNFKNNLLYMLYGVVLYSIMFT